MPDDKPKIDEQYKTLEQYERSYCDCNQCKTACRHMPGTLAPGEMEKIAAYCEQKPTVEFLQNFFVASDGPIVAKKNSDGSLTEFQIPTLVPAQLESGECVFLSPDGECEIHPVAPFGCRNYKVCDPPSQADDEKSAHLLNVIVVNPPYQATVKYLRKQGLVAAPLQERKRSLINALKEDKR